MTTVAPTAQMGRPPEDEVVYKMRFRLPNGRTQTWYTSSPSRMMRKARQLGDAVSHVSVYTRSA